MRLLSLLAAAAAVSACVSAPTASALAPPPGSIAYLKGPKGEEIGQAMIQQVPTGVVIDVEVKGLTPGWHGVHIHAVAQCEAPFTSAGGHVNHGEPKDPHGLLNAQGPDDGDLPNIHADEQGRVRAEVFTTRARIARDGPGQWLWDADGSALVIHANADDHSSQPIGGAGARVACGIMAAG